MFVMDRGLVKPIIKHSLSYFVIQNVSQDTLDIIVQENVLSLLTETHAKKVATVALTDAICPWAV